MGNNESPLTGTASNQFMLWKSLTSNSKVVVGKVAVVGGGLSAP